MNIFLSLCIFSLHQRIRHMCLSLDILLYERIYLYLGFFRILNNIVFREYPQLMIRMVAHDCAYVHVVFNGCRRATEKGKRSAKHGRDKGDTYASPSSSTAVGSATVASSSSRATPGTVGLEEKREMTGWKGERCGAEAVEGRRGMTMGSIHP